MNRRKKHLDLRKVTVNSWCIVETANYTPPILLSNKDLEPPV